MIAAAVVAVATGLGTAASAVTLTGTFGVAAVNATNLNTAQSAATLANFHAAAALSNGSGPFDDGDSAAIVDLFTYTGDIDFRVGGPQKASPYTIGDWLATGSGTVSGIDPVFAAKQLSFPNIGKGTATTTFFLFTLQSTGLNLSAISDFDVTHDDGVLFFENFNELGGFAGPTGVRDTTITGYAGGQLDMLYVATNGNPSVFEVDVEVVPLPAGAWLLLGGLGALAAVRRRKAA